MSIEPLTSYKVNQTQLLRQSVSICAYNDHAAEKKLADWSRDDLSESYVTLQRLVKALRSDNYMVYSKISDAEQPFSWEILPYQPCRTFIGRIIQQIQVLWRIAFGGITISEKECNEQRQKLESLLVKIPENHTPPASKHEFPNISEKPTTEKTERPCNFCEEDIIAKQVVFTGKKVNILLSHAPIGLGGERLHFLAVSKEHREKFSDLTQDEYCEAMDLTQKLNTYLGKTRKIENAYLFHKTGKDAGQTVPHWHLHLIFTSNKVQDIWGKLTVVKNILLGSSRLKDDKLKELVDAYRREFASLQSQINP